MRLTGHISANDCAEIESRKQILSRTAIEMRACRESRRPYALPRQVCGVMLICSVRHRTVGGPLARCNMGSHQTLGIAKLPDVYPYEIVCRKAEAFSVPLSRIEGHKPNMALALRACILQDCLQWLRYHVKRPGYFIINPFEASGCIAPHMKPFYHPSIACFPRACTPQTFPTPCPPHQH